MQSQKAAEDCSIHFQLLGGRTVFRGNIISFVAKPMKDFGKAYIGLTFWNRLDTLNDFCLSACIIIKIATISPWVS